MKRRTFFSKLTKGLLGIGIFSAVPKAEPKAEPVSDLDLSINDLNSPQGMVFGDDGAYIIDGDDNVVAVGIETADGEFIQTRQFNLPEFGKSDYHLTTVNKAKK